MSNHLKEYVVLGTTYGIEDFKSPGEHFFDGKKTDGRPRPRFMLWAGGCGIGTAKTPDEADTKLYQYILERVNNKLETAEAAVAKYKQAEYHLLMFKNNLVRFKVPKIRKTK